MSIFHCHYFAYFEKFKKTEIVMYLECHWSCPSKFWNILLVAKYFYLCFLTCVKEISNWQAKLIFFFWGGGGGGFLKHKTIDVIEKRLLVPICLIWKLMEYTNDHQGRFQKEKAASNLLWKGTLKSIISKKPIRN